MAGLSQGIIRRPDHRDARKNYRDKQEARRCFAVGTDSLKGFESRLIQPRNTRWTKGCAEFHSAQVRRNPFHPVTTNFKGWEYTWLDQSYLPPVDSQAQCWLAANRGFNTPTRRAPASCSRLRFACCPAAGLGSSRQRPPRRSRSVHHFKLVPQTVK